jgi:hypothetical protein
LQLFGRFAPRPAPGPDRNYVAHVSTAFGGEGVHHKQFRIAQIGVRLFPDKGVDWNIGLPGNGGRDEPEAAHLHHAQTVE